MSFILSGLRSSEPRSTPERGRLRSFSVVAEPPDGDSPRPPDAVHLPRAASYTYFPQVKDAVVDDTAVVGFKGTFSEGDLDGSTASNHDGDSYLSSGGSSPDTEPTTPSESKPLELTAHPRDSKITISAFTQPVQPSQAQLEYNAAEAQRKANAAATETNALSRQFTKLRRKSWKPMSRSPSPKKREARDGTANDGTPTSTGWGLSAGRRKSFSLERRSTNDTEAGSVTPSKKSTLLVKKPKKPSSVLLKGLAEPIPSVPALPSLPKSFSTDRLPSLTRSIPSPERVPPVPRNPSPDKSKPTKVEIRKKDELWSVFRTLDSDLQKFQSKSIALKANVVRSTLLPFLRSYASHPSNLKLRPEDLDRRANILNRWWTGLLEMLHGRNNQSISGTDRPAILEGTVGIMERPEWRLYPSPFCPLSDRIPPPMASRSTSSTSLASAGSDFLTESVNHNVRNMFTQNLLAQMAFVIDKMSLRSAPASLVSFSGKTCAYAFLFCPGVADVLIRLWSPTMETIRRILNECGIQRHAKLDGVSKRICSPFPPALHHLRFSSLSKIMRELREPASLPLGTANLQWHGPWLNRWSGRETDLFYIFVKHYHILLAGFLPAEATKMERACAPGVLMVHAQLLTNLDSTIHRHAILAQDEPLNGPSGVTFDDVLSDPDATATIPLPPSNASRLMAENRLIMLIRDFLSERSSGYVTARHIFAQAFSDILKAAASRTSVYDQHACYTLCDFLEEAIVILVRYEHITSNTDPVLDWSFWLEVCKQMIQSQNTTTEIRLFSFLYTIWPTMTSNDERRKDLCRNFLLEPEFFESRFNHWCPMVRTYYMRLLCWRVARFDGEAIIDEIETLQQLRDNLRTVWSHFIYLMDEAQANHNILPSTAPCNPAPGRRLLIVRSDPVLSPPSGSFLSFDGVVSPMNSSPQGNAPKTPSPLSRVSTLDFRPPSVHSSFSDSSDCGQDDETSRKPWSILRSIIGTTKSKSRPNSRTTSPTRCESKASTLTPSISASSTPSQSPNSLRQSSVEPSTPPQYRIFSFRFSLEWVDRRFHSPGNMRLHPPRLPPAAQQTLLSQCKHPGPVQRVRPRGKAEASSRYAGRALAEWAMVVNEYQNFCERRRNEGVPSERCVETPTLGVEAFKRPG